MVVLGSSLGLPAVAAESGLAVGKFGMIYDMTVGGVVVEGKVGITVGMNDDGLAAGGFVGDGLAAGFADGPVAFGCVQGTLIVGVLDA